MSANINQYMLVHMFSTSHCDLLHKTLKNNIICDIFVHNGAITFTSFCGELRNYGVRLRSRVVLP